MERSPVIRLIFIATATAVLSACAATTQLAQGIADKAPLAKPPEIIKVGARLWDGDPTYYNSGDAFEFVVKHGLANELLVKENGIDLARVSGVPAPSASANSVFWRAATVTNDTTAQTTTERVRILTKESQAPGAFVPPPDGTERTYSLIEQSIHPRATGKDGLGVGTGCVPAKSERPENLVHILSGMHGPPAGGNIRTCLHRRRSAGANQQMVQV